MSGLSSGPAAGSAADRRELSGASPLPEQQPAVGGLGALVGGGGRIEALERYGTLAARVLIGQIFLISGVLKIVNWSGTEAEMAEHGMFWVPLFHVAAMLVELGAGLSLLLGCKARLGALTLFLFLIPVTLTFHHFWTYSGEKQKVNTMFFMHNLALLGGLLLLMITGPGPLSIDGKGRRRP